MTTSIPPTQDDIIIGTLKKKYFELLSKENYPHTPEITKEVNNLEEAIKKLSV